MRKLLSIFMSIVLVVGLMPLPAYAQPSEAGGQTAAAGQKADAADGATTETGTGHAAAAAIEATDGVDDDMTAQSSRYEFEDLDGCWLLYEDYSDDECSGVVITEIGVPTIYRGPWIDMVIPSEIDGKAVVGIGFNSENGFSHYNVGYIKRLTIPASVRFVYGLYFNGVGADDTDHGHVGDGAIIFEEGSPVAEFYPGAFRQSNAPTIVLPDGLTTISNEMFQQAKLTSLVLPENVKSIGYRAFQDAEKMTSITLNEGLEFIGQEAFASIPGSGFDGYQGGYDNYSYPPKLTTVDIPDSVTEIDDGAFRRVTTLGSVSFGTSPQKSKLERIGDRAFCGTSITDSYSSENIEYKSVVIPDSVKNIGAEAFTGYAWGPVSTNGHVLSNVQLGSSQEASQLFELGPRSFAGQPITSITLPNSLLSLGYESEDYGWKANNDVGLGDFTSAEAAGEGVELSSLKYARCDGKRGYSTHMYVPDGNYPAATMGAFSGCDKLETIVWPTEPGLNAVGGFDNCVSLTEEAIESLPNWVTVIDDYAFYNCVTPGSWGTATTNLRNVTIPSTVVRVGKGAFSKRPDGEYALGGAAPVYTLTNPAVQLDYDEDNMVATSPWPIGCGYTVRYPASASADSDIVKYRAAVEAYEAEMKVQYGSSYDYAYTIFIAVPDTEHAINGTVPEGATATLLVNGEAAEPVEGAVFATALEGSQVAVTVSMDGYADYTVAPEGGRLNADWSFAVTEGDLTPLSETGALYVAIQKERPNTEESWRAAIGCNVVVFDTAGHIVVRGITPTSGAFVIDALPAGTYTVVAYDSNEWFSGIASVDDFARLGVKDGSWAMQEATVEAGQTTELVLVVPDLQAATAEDILDAGGVSVSNQRLVPALQFNARVSYVMKVGCAASKITVNIPEGIVPVSANTSNCSYGIGSYDATTGVLTVNLQADDKQSGMLYVGLKVVDGGSYSVSASISSGTATAPLGSVDISAPAMTLLVPKNDVEGTTFDVDVYATPRSTVRFLVAGAAADTTVATNAVGHGKATLTLPEDQRPAAAFAGEFDVVAYLGDDVETSTVTDAQTVSYRGIANIESGAMEWEFSFEHAGQKVYLTRDGKYQQAVGYTVVKASHQGGRWDTATWPFTYVAVSDRPLGETALLGLRMLDGSQQVADLQLAETQDLGGGRVRYTYTADVPIGQKGRDYGLSDIPNGFSAVPSYTDDSIYYGARTYTQSEVDEFKAKVPTASGDWWKRSTDMEEAVLGTQGVAYANRNELYFQYAPNSYAALVAAGENPADADILDVYIFNSAYHHENWADSTIWNKLDAETREGVLELEEGMDQLCMLWQEIFDTTRPLNEYSSIVQYLQENFNYQEGVTADPAELEAQGYQVIYDDNPVDDAASWYAVRYTPPEISKDDDDMEGASDGALSAQENESGEGGKVEITTSAGTSLKKWYQFYKDHATEASQLVAWMSTGLAKLDAKAVAGTAWKGFLGFGSKALTVIGTVTGIIGLYNTWSDFDNQDIGLHTTRAYNRRNQARYELAQLEKMGKQDTPCYRAKLQEYQRAQQYYETGMRRWFGLGFDTLFNSEMFILSVTTCGEACAGVRGAQAMEGTIQGAEAYRQAVSTVKGSAALSGAGSAEAIGMYALNHYSDVKEAQRLARNARDWAQWVCRRAPEPDHKAALYIDPSGWVFEGTPDNLVSGATATIYELVDGQWVEWDAADHDQVNPQVLGEAGFFHWDTPPGKWKVVFTADGYDAAVVDLDGSGTAFEYEAQDAAETPSMDVPPEWTNIIVGLLAETAPQVTDVALSDDDASIVVTFDQYMDASVAPKVTVDGAAAKVTWDESVDGIGATGAAAKLSKSLRVPVPASAEPGAVLKVAISGGKSYAGKAVASTTSNVTLPGMPRIDIAGATVTAIPDQTHTGKALTPAVTVKVGGKTLKVGTDYTAAYKNNVNVGTATVTLTGKGAYKGTKAVTFKIVAADNPEPPGPGPEPDPPVVKKNVSELRVEPIPDQTYTGEFIFPWEFVKVYDGDKLLEAEVDYQLAVPDNDNVNPGIGKMLLGGTGNYEGVRTIEFKIVVEGPASWKRLAGDNAFKTMSAVIDEGGFEAGGTVVLASLEGYWDALTAAGIAGLEQAPVVMSMPDGLSPEATAQLAKLAPKKVVVCGGTYWLPDALLAEAKAAAGTNPEVVRLAGDNAALTAGKIAEAGKGRWSDTAIVATAGTFQDALAAAPLSWANAMPIFLAQFDFAAERGYITADTVKAMKDAGVKKCYIAGGTYWIPKQVSADLQAAGIEVLGQLMGENATITSVEIAKVAIAKYGMHADGMGVANVAQHYDALAGASFCGKLKSVLLLALDQNSASVAFARESAGKVAAGYVLGGTGSVSAETMAAFENATK